MSGLISCPAFRTVSLALAAGAAVALAPLAARAASTNAYQVKVPTSFEYNTTGIIRTTAPAAAKTVTGPNQLTFDGVSRGSYVTDSNQPIQLGQFVVHPTTNANGSAAVTTYDHTPFVIQVHAPGYDKTSKVPLLANALPNFGRTFHLQNQTVNSLLVRGHLDGTVSANSNSSVTATVDSVKLGSLAAPDKKYATSYTFPVRSTDLRLPTSWTMNTAGTATSTTSTASSLNTPTTATTTSSNLSTATPAGGTVSAAQILANPAAETLSATPTTSTNLASTTATTASPAAEMLTTTSTNLATPTPTPEPTTALIFAAGLGALAVARRRHQVK